jgi:hypothetical protein
MTLLHLLMQMGVRGFVTSNAPLFENLTAQDNLQRLEGIPMMLFSGGDNHVLNPRCTDMTYELLRNKFGPNQYERHVIPGYGHLDCWMGRQAYKDVYPIIRRQVDKVCRGETYKYKEPNWKDWRDWKGTKKTV